MVTPQIIETASLGMADSLILMVLALVVFGPRRLPEIGRQLGKLMFEFRKASNDFKFQMEEELRTAEAADRRKREDAERQRTLALVAPAQSAAAAPAPEAATADSGVYPKPLPTTDPHLESHLLIQPPSTGEPVAAERPGSAIVPAATAEVDIAANGNSDSTTTEVIVSHPEEKEPAANQSGTAVEPAAHHD
jgi:sec-independent protein translocase protein TatB